MATVILYTQQAQGVVGYVSIGLVIVLMCGLILVVLRAGDRMSKFPGVTGVKVLTRLMCMILAAIATEMMAGGLSELFPELHQAG